MERQIELSKKYGVSDELIAKMQDEKTSKEEKDKTFGQIVATLANAIIRSLIDPNDIEDVSAIVGPRYGLSKSEYLPFWNLKQLQELF